MTADVKVREATSADVAALVVLVNSAYRGESSKAGWATEADLLGGQRIDDERLMEMIASPGTVILVHEQHGPIVACVQLERTGETGYLGLLTVNPTMQAAGLGGRLLDAAERWAVERWGSRAMQMTVIVQRLTLIAWYERRGYRRTGEHKPFPYGDERFGVPRRPDLEFEILSKVLAPLAR